MLLFRLRKECLVIQRKKTNNTQSQKLQTKTQLSKPGVPFCLRWRVQDKECPIFLEGTTNPDLPLEKEGSPCPTATALEARPISGGRERKITGSCSAKESARYAISISADKQHIYRTGKTNYVARKAQQPEIGKLIDPESKELVPDVCKWDVTKMGQLNFKALRKTKEQESQ